MIGLHQKAAREVRLDFGGKQHIELNRRVTGGGAIFFDSTQLGWEIVASRQLPGAGTTLASLTRLVCEAAVRGLAKLGLKARFRARNDIEVKGRKISGTGGAWEGDSFLFQGTLLVEFDPEIMVRALRIPTEKLARHELEAVHDRVTCLARELARTPPLAEIKAAMEEGFAEALGILLRPGDLTSLEMERAAHLRPFYASLAWLDEIREPIGNHRLLTSIHAGTDGTIRTLAALDLRHHRIKSVLFTGYFFVSPSGALYDLAASLKDCAFTDADHHISGCFTDTRAVFI